MVRLGIARGGRNRCNVWLVIAFEESGKATHFEKGGRKGV